MNTMNMLEETARNMDAKWPRKKLSELEIVDDDERQALEKDLDGAVLVAAALKEWGVVYDLLENGQCPNKAEGGAVDLPILPWVDDRLREDESTYNGNILLLAAATMADDTVVRYLVARAAKVGATELGMALLPAVYFASYAADDGLWLLEKMSLSNDAFADAFSAALFVAVNQDMAQVKGSLKALLVKRGIAEGPLLHMYAQLPSAIHPRDARLTMDADEAMAAKYPAADDATVSELANALPGPAKGDLSILLPLAFVERRWSVVHALVKRGITPRTLAPSRVARALKKVAKAAGADPETLSGAGMAAIAADAGDMTVLRFVLAHGDALCVPMNSYIVLPAVAERAGHTWAAKWLLSEGLGLSTYDLAKAASLTVQAAAARGNICLTAMLFEAAVKYLSNQNVQEDLVADLVERALSCSLDNAGFVRSVLQDSHLPQTVVATAASRVLEYADDAEFDAYVMLLSAADLVSLCEMTQDYANAVKDGNQQQVQDMLSAADDMERSKLVRYATVHAALNGQTDLLMWLFQAQEAAKAVQPCDVDTVMLAAAMSAKSDTLAAALDGLKSDSDEFLEGAVATLRFLGSNKRADDSMAVLKAVSGRPEAHDLAELAVVAACVYGTGADLTTVLQTCVEMVPQDDRAWTFVAALEGAYESKKDAVQKVAQLLAFAAKQADVYAMAARLAVVEAATVADAQTLRDVEKAVTWPSQDVRQAALCAAAAAACENDNADVLGAVLDLAGPIDTDTRLTWALQPNTAKIVLDPVSTDDLLDEKRNFTNSDFLLVTTVLESRELTDAQKNRLADAQAQRKSFEARIEEVRSELESRLSAAFNAIFGDASDAANVSSASSSAWSASSSVTSVSGGKSPASINTDVLKERFESRGAVPPASPSVTTESNRDERPLV